MKRQSMLVGLAGLLAGVCACAAPGAYGQGYDTGGGAYYDQRPLDPEGYWCFHDERGQALANYVERTPTGIRVMRAHPTQSAFHDYQQHGPDFLEVGPGNTYAFLPGGQRAIWRSGQRPEVIEMWRCEP